MSDLPAYKIFALSDAALTIDFGNSISDIVNDHIISLFKKLQQHPLGGMIEAVPAYSSLTLYYDVISLRKKIPKEKTVFDWMKNEVLQFLKQEKEIYQNERRVINIPVCYENVFAPDIEWASSQINIPIEEIIKIHTSKTYRVYMIGFLPGFAYMGQVDDRIVLPRKPQPVPVAAGSVGIAGRQTGVYPLSSPGGWQIIGRTPVIMFKAPSKPSSTGKTYEDSESRNFFEDPTLLKAGDYVKFYSISTDEFIFLKNNPPLTLTTEKESVLRTPSEEDKI